MKLEDIPKKEIFEVPEGYFDKLPLAIQDRVSELQKKPSLGVLILPKLKYALPVVAILIAGAFWLNPSAPDTETILATIQTEDLIAYLNESDLTTDEVVEAVDFDADDLDEIESQVYLDLTDQDFDEVD